MIARAFAVRREADADFDEALDYYLTEAGDLVAMRFVDAVMDTHRIIADSPKIGSRRLEEQVSVVGLRSLRTHGFPYLVIYLETDGRVEIWRLLHAQPDLMAALDSGDA